MDWLVVNELIALHISPRISYHCILLFPELSLDYCKLCGGVHFMDSMPTTPTGKIVRGTVKKIIVDKYNRMQLANIVHSELLALDLL